MFVVPIDLWNRNSGKKFLLFESLYIYKSEETLRNRHVRIKINSRNVLWQQSGVLYYLFNTFPIIINFVNISLKSLNSEKQTNKMTLKNILR